MFEIAKDLLDKISSAILPGACPVPVGPGIEAACGICQGTCKNDCKGTCKGSCKGGCTRSCKGSSR